MKYNPDKLEYQRITKEQLDIFNSIDKELSLELLKTERNIHELAIDFVYQSAQLEGNTYDQHDTRVLIESGQTAGGKMFSDAVMILNLRDNFNQILNQKSRTILSNPKLLFNFIKDCHARISANLVLPHQSGVVRDEPVLISGTKYTPLRNKENLNSEMKYLCSVASKIENPYEQAIYLHNNIAYLQYFVDCNKRTARSLMMFTLLSHDKFPILFCGSKADYINNIINYYENNSHYNSSADYFLKLYEQTKIKYGVTEDPIINRKPKIV